MRRLRFGLLTAGVLAAVGCGNPLAVLKTPPPETSEKIDDRNTNYRPGGSALGNAARAGKRTAQLHDFEQLGTIIFALELDNSRMPTVDAIKADLKANPDAREILAKIDEGVIILTGTTDRQALWAYEIDADKAGGIILVNGRASRASADDVKDWLGKK
jgi:hypothetical protein